MSKSHAEPQVVIYGGGIAGAILAKELSANHRVTLVDPNEYFEVPMSVPRSLVKPAFADKAIVPFAQALPKVNVVRGSLIELTAKGGLVKLVKGGEALIKGRVTVLATGSAFSNPLMRSVDGASVSERKDFYSAYQKRINEAQKILIVGGGPIGVELAGEIVENHPQKSVTILEAGARIMGGTSEEASKHAETVLRRNGVKILTNEKLERASSGISDIFASGGEATTTSGLHFNYDLLIWCTGGKPNTAYMRPHYAALLNAAGRVRVTAQLQVTGLDNVFALGDITDLDENKMAWHIAGQVKVASYNIQQVLKGSAGRGSLKSYRPQTGNPMMAVTLGSRNGVLHLPVIGVVRIPCFARIAKSGHMLVPKTRKALGV